MFALYRDPRGAVSDAAVKPLLILGVLVGVVGFALVTGRIGREWVRIKLQ